MTIRKQLLIALISVAVITVIINSGLSTYLVNKNFNDYTKNNYEKNANQIVSVIENSLENKEETIRELRMILQGYLDSPIIGISVYSNNGSEILSIGNNSMHGMMMSTNEAVDTYKLEVNNKPEGFIYIRRHSEINVTDASVIFKQAVLTNSILVGALAIIIAILISIYISKGTVKDLQETRRLAQGINLGDDIKIKISKIKEIRFIQDSLKLLDSKLKLKQKARKQLLDEMIHQTRTPLTILKTHLEAYGDEIIELNEEEVDVCIEQVDNITTIISNMSQMIESDREKEIIKKETLNLNKLIHQIGSGLKIQFKNKGIEFIIKDNEEIVIETDKYRVSQSIYNILTNAYKFTNKNGTVIISCYKEGKNIVIKVEDNGIGIKKDDFNNIFNPYYRGINTENIKGEGIGLYVVKENIESIGGRVILESVYGVGTVIKLII